MGKFLGNVEARGFHKIFSTLPARWKQSPIHVAAATGDLAIVKVLAEHENFPLAQYADTKGRTPVDLCANETVKTAIAELVGPAAVATPIPGNKVAPNNDYCPALDVSGSTPLCVSSPLRLFSCARGPRSSRLPS